MKALKHTFLKIFNNSPFESTCLIGIIVLAEIVWVSKQVLLNQEYYLTLSIFIIVTLLTMIILLFLYKK